MGHTNNIPEARCPKCGWEGLWEDVLAHILYRATEQDPECVEYVCPLCLTEVDTTDAQGGQP